MTEEFWRCERCGKWSHAKRRPLRHKVWHQHDEEERWRGWFVWCGPFRRWEAAPTDDVGAVEYVAVGQVVSETEQQIAMSAGDALGAF
jgi:hypothetical protein